MQCFRRLLVIAVISLSSPGFSFSQGTYETGSIFGLFAPAKTTDPIIRRLNQETVRFLHTKEAKERFLDAGAEAVGSTPEEFATVIKAETAKWGKVIKNAGITAD
jgi:tripartite-type tricarboxylate transporter receptor subunit TctC